MSLNLGTTQIIIRKKPTGQDAKNIICSEVISDIQGKRKFVGSIPTDFPSGELDENTVDVETDVIIKIGDVELSRKEIGASLNVPTIPTILVDNTPPEIKVDFQGIDGQNIKLTFDYIADENIVVDESDPTAKVNGKGKFQLQTDGGTGQRNKGKSNRYMPGTAQNTRKPGKNFTFTIIALPYHEGKLYKVEQGETDWNYYEEIDESGFSDSGFVKNFIKNQISIKATKSINGIHNREYLPVVEYEIAQDPSDGNAHKIKIKNDANFIEQDAINNLISLTLSSTADLIQGYTGLYKVFAVGSDHINNFSALTVVSTNEVDNTIRVLDIEPPIAQLTSAVESSEGLPSISVSGYYYDLVTPVDSYVLVLDQDLDIHTYVDGYNYEGIDATRITNGQSIKSFMENNPSSQIATSSLVIDSSSGTFTSNITQYYNSTTSAMESIVTGKSYFVYMLVSETGTGVGATETFYQNNVFSKSAQISFQQSIQNFTVSANGIIPAAFPNRSIMYKNRIINFKWNMKFDHSDISELQLAITDKDNNPIALTPVTTDPSFDYAASYQFIDETLFNNGRLQFSLVYTGTNQTLTHTNISNEIYFQNSVSLSDADLATSWYLSANANSALLPHNILNINNVYNAIEKNMTLDTNPYVMSGLPFTINVYRNNTVNQTIDNVSRISPSSYANLASSLQLTGLVEQTDYNVKLGISFSFDQIESASFTTNNSLLNTGFDDPTISDIGKNPAYASTVGEMRINAPSYEILDKTSTVNTYAFFVRASDTGSFTDEQLYNFAKTQGNQAGAILVDTNYDPNVSKEFRNLSAFTYYYTTSFSPESLSKNIASYIFVIIAEDNSPGVKNFIVTRTAPVTFTSLKEMSITSITTTNSRTPNTFLTNSDDITVNFKTNFNAVTSDFDIRIFNSSVTPSSLDGRNWTLTTTLPADWTTNAFFGSGVINTFTYVGENKKTLFDTNTVYIKVDDPVVDFTDDNIITGDSNLSDRRFQFQNIDVNEYNPFYGATDGLAYTGYSFKFTAFNSKISTSITLATTGDAGTVEHLTTALVQSRFEGVAITSLEMGEIYTIRLDVTDPAGNQFSSTPFTLRTFDTQGITLELDGVAQPNSAFLDASLVQPTYNLSGYGYDNVDVFNVYLIVSSQHIDEAQMYVMTSDAEYQSLFLVDNYVPGSLSESNSQWSVSNIQNEHTLSTDGLNTITETPLKSEQLYYAYVISRQLDASNVEIDSEDSVNFNKIALATFQQVITEDSFVSDNEVSTSFAENSNNITLNLDAFRYLEHETNFNIQFKASDVSDTLLQTYSPVIEHQTNINVTVSGGKYVFDPMPSRFIEGLTYVFDQSDATNNTHPLGYVLDSSLLGAVPGEASGVVKNGVPGSTGAYTEMTFTGGSNVLIYFICENHSDMGSVLRTTIQDMTGHDGFQVVEEDGLDTIWKATLNVAPVEIGKLNYQLALNRDIENVISVSNDPTAFITIQHQLELQPFNVYNVSHNSFTLSNLDQIIDSSTCPTLELNDFQITISLTNTDNTFENAQILNTSYSKADLGLFTYVQPDLTEGSTCELSITTTDIYGNSDTISTFYVNGGASNVDSFTLSSSPPTIQVTTPPTISTSGDITVSTAATFKDEHSSFAGYTAMFQGHVTFTEAQLNNFFVTLGLGVKHLQSTKNTDLPISNTFTGFYDTVTSPTFKNDIIPTDGTDFTVYYYVVDSSVQQNAVMTSSNVSFDYSDYVSGLHFSTLDLRGSDPFYKAGDVISILWTSKYISAADTFDVTVNGSNLTPTSTNSTNWNVVFTVPMDTTTNKQLTFNIDVAGNSFSESTNIYMDNVKPSYTIDLIGDQKEVGTIKLDNLVFTSSLPTGYPNGSLDGSDASILDRYNFIITVTNQTTSAVTIETKNLSAWNYVDNTTVFRVTGLTSGESYTVTTSMTDPVGNESGLINPSITTFQVKDVAGPIFQEGTDEAMRLVAQTPIEYQEYILGNINVIDLHSTYDVHVALFESRSNPDLVALRDIAHTSTNTQSFLNNPPVSVTSDPNYAGPFQTQPFSTYIDLSGNEVTGSNVFTVGQNYTFLAYAVDSAGNYSTDYKTLTITTQAPPVYDPTEEEKPEVDGVAQEDVVGQTTEVDPNTGTSTTVDESGNTITGNENTTAEADPDTGTVTNTFEEGGALVADEDNNPLYDDSSGTAEPEPQFTRTFETVTPTALPSESNPNPQYLESMDENHYIRFNSDGQIELKWGGSNSEPLVAPIEFENGVSYDISYTVNTETNTISIIVDGVEYAVTTEDVSTPTDSALVTGGFANEGDASDVSNSFIGSMETPTTITVALTETQVNSYLSGTKKLMEFMFDDFQEGASNEQFESTVSTLSIPLVVVGSSAVIDVEYPRAGRGAYKLDESYHLEAALPVDALTSVSMTVMLWYKSTDNTFGSDLIRLQSSSNDDFVKIGLQNNKMVVAFDDSDGLHTDASQTFTPLSANTWNHLAYVFIANNIYFYLNGQYIGGGLDHVHDTFSFSKMIVGGGVSTQGSIDLLSVYRTKLTRTAIVSNMREALHKRMVLRYDFENTEGTQVFDESKSLANTATMHADPASAIVSNAPISAHAMRFDGIDDHIELYGSSDLDLSNLQHATFTCFIRTEEDSVGSKEYIPILYKENSYKLGIDFSQSDAGANRKGIAKLEMYNHFRGKFENLPSINPKEGLPALMAQHIRISGQSNYSTPVAEFKFEDNTYSMTTTNTTILPSSTGIVFDESTDVVNLGGSVLSNTDEEMTLSMWVKVKQEDMHKNMALMSMDDAFTMGLNNGVPYFMTPPEFFPGYTKEVATDTNGININSEVSLSSTTDSNLSPLTMYNIASYTPLTTKKEVYNKIELELEKNPDLGVVFTEPNATSSTVATVSNIDFNGVTVPVTAVPSAYVYTLATDGTLADVKLGNALVQVKGMTDPAVTFYDAASDGSFTKVAIDDYSISESNVLTINSGYAVSTSPFDNVWVFAVTGNGIPQEPTPKYQWWRMEIEGLTGTATYYRGHELGIFNTDYTESSGGYTLENTERFKVYFTGGVVHSGPTQYVKEPLINSSGTYLQESSSFKIFNLFNSEVNVAGSFDDRGLPVTMDNTINGVMYFDFQFENPIRAKHVVFTDADDATSSANNGGIKVLNVYHADNHSNTISDWTLYASYTNEGTTYYSGETHTKVLTYNDTTTFDLGAVVTNFASYNNNYDTSPTTSEYPIIQYTPEQSGWTSSQLQTMATLYTQIPDQGLAHYTYSSTTDPNLTAKSFEGLTMTHAFSNINSASITPITADTQYTVVAVGEQDGEYVAGYANLVLGPPDTDALVNTPTVLLYDLYSGDTPTMLFDNIKSSATLGTDSLLFNNGLHSANNNIGSKGYVYLKLDTVVRLSKLRIWQVTGDSSGRAVGSVWVTMTETERTSADVTTMFSSATRLMDSISSPNTGYTTITEDGVDVVEINVDSTANLTGSYMYIRFGSQDATKGLTEIAELEIYSYVDGPTTATTQSLTWTPSASNNDISKTAIDDYSITESNVLTINSGYAVSTSPFDNVWVFAVTGNGAVVANDNVLYMSYKKFMATSANTWATDPMYPHELKSYLVIEYSDTTREAILMNTFTTLDSAWTTETYQYQLTSDITNFFVAFTIQQHDTSFSDVGIDDITYTINGVEYVIETTSANFTSKFTSGDNSPTSTKLLDQLDTFGTIDGTVVIIQSNKTEGGSPPQEIIPASTDGTNYLYFEGSSTTGQAIYISTVQQSVSIDADPASTPAFTSTQLQTMATLFTQIPDQGLAHYTYSSTTDPNLTAKSFEGLTMTHAFSNINSAAITPITADTQYTVVAVGEQKIGDDTEYVAGFANKVAGSTEGWVLLVRDTASSPFPNTFRYNASSSDLNIGTLSDTSYSRLGDLKDETGDFSNENLKTNDTYLFRIHVYTTQNGTVDPNSYELPNSEGAYIQWTQTYNPINTTHTGVTTTDLSDLINDGFRTDGRPLQIGGSVDERNIHVLRQSSTSNYVLVMGFNLYYNQLGKTTSDPFSYNVTPGETEHMVELYVWKGAKPSDLSVPVTATIIPDVVTTQTLTWTPSASNNDFSKTAIDDYSISESNVLTINSGYAISTSPFDNVWVFAVVPPVVEVETPYVVDFSALNDSSATSGSVTVTANQVDAPQGSTYAMIIDTTDLDTIHDIEFTIPTRNSGENDVVLNVDSKINLIYIRQDESNPTNFRPFSNSFRIDNPEYEVDPTINGTARRKDLGSFLIKKIRFQAVDPSTIPTTGGAQGNGKDVDGGSISLSYTANDVRISFYDDVNSDSPILYTFLAWSALNGYTLLSSVTFKFFSEDVVLKLNSISIPVTTPEVSFTTSQLQTMATLFTQIPDQGLAHYTYSSTTDPNLTAKSFEGLTMTHAFSNINSASITPITADTQYTVVAVGEQSGEYVAGYASLGTEGSSTLAFHHGNFDDRYADGTVEEAANNGHVYADTPIQTYSWGTLDSRSMTTTGTTYSWTPPASFTATNLLMVAGGGGGGSWVGGGGGAGGLLAFTNMGLVGQKTLVVGNGGTGSIYNTSQSSPGGNGSNTTFTGLTDAIGGGGGGSYSSSSATIGGSGGGGGYPVNGAAGTSGQGNAGGNGVHQGWSGGGGGGAGQVGYNGSGQIGGNGGDGLDYSSVFGTSYGDAGWFAGGGGGCGQHSTAGYQSTGGRGGGADGGNDYIQRGESQPHTGGGGGGTRDKENNDGSDGGSGIIIMNYGISVAKESVLTWTPSASNNDISKVAIDDYSISDSNVLTINSGYAVTNGSPFDNVWVFAVVAEIGASNNEFTTTEIQTMVTTHIENGTTEGTDYHKYTNVSRQLFNGETLTNAFSSIDGSTTEAIDSASDYIVVAVGEQGGEYVANVTAGQGTALQVGDFELDIANYSSGTIANIGKSAVNSSYTITGSPSLASDSFGSYIDMASGDWINLGDENSVFNPPMDMTLFYAFRLTTTGQVIFQWHANSVGGFQGHVKISYGQTTQFNIDIGGQTSNPIPSNMVDVFKVMITYNHADSEFSYLVYNASQGTIVKEDTVSGSRTDISSWTINGYGQAAGHSSTPGQDLYTCKVYKQHVSKLPNEYENFIYGTTPPPTITTQTLTWTASAV